MKKEEASLISLLFPTLAIICILQTISLVLCFCIINTLSFKKKIEIVQPSGKGSPFSFENKMAEEFLENTPVDVTIRALQAQVEQLKRIVGGDASGLY